MCVFFGIYSSVVVAFALTFHLMGQVGLISVWTESRASCTLILEYSVLARLSGHISCVYLPQFSIL